MQVLKPRSYQQCACKPGNSRGTRTEGQRIAGRKKRVLLDIRGRLDTAFHLGGWKIPTEEATSPRPPPVGGPSTVTLVPSDTQTTMGCSCRAIDNKQKLVLTSLHLFSLRVCNCGDRIQGFTHSKPMSTCSVPRLYTASSHQRISHT